MKEFFRAIDWTIGIFNVIVGCLCISSAICNILIYGISIRLIALAVFFCLSGLIFISLEFYKNSAIFSKNQFSHLNNYHGRSTHFLLLASLSCDSFESKDNLSLGYLIWLWSNTLALASFSLAFAIMAIIHFITPEHLPLPKSMDYKRSLENNSNGKQDKIHKSDGIFEYESTSLENSKSLTQLSTSSSWRNGLIMIDSNERPLSYNGRQNDNGNGILFEPISLNYEKDDFFSKHSLPFHQEDFNQQMSRMSMSNHTLVDMHNDHHQQKQNLVTNHKYTTNRPRSSSSSTSLSPPQSKRLTKSSSNSPLSNRVDTLLQFSNVPQQSSSEAIEQLNSARTSMVQNSTDSTSKIGGISKFFNNNTSNQRRNSTTPSLASLRYETVNEKKVAATNAIDGKTSSTFHHSNHISSPFHHQISYDENIDQNSFDEGFSNVNVPKTPPLKLSIKKQSRSRSRKRVYVPSIGAAIDLSSGSESETNDDSEICLNASDDDHDSIYSLPSGISPAADDVRQQFLTNAAANSSRKQNQIDSNDGQFGRRLTRKETQSVRRKVDRGIQRALSQRREEQ